MSTGDKSNESKLASYIGISGPETPKYLLLNNLAVFRKMKKEEKNSIDMKTFERRKYFYVKRITSKRKNSWKNLLTIFFVDFPVKS